MSNVINLSGDYIDPSKELDRLIAENSKFVDDIADIYATTDTLPSPADVRTAEWLMEIVSKHTSQD